MREFIRQLPKAELHVHLEGTLEAEQKFELARRNHIALPYSCAQEMRAGYAYHDLASFLALYYEGVNVLLQEQDFYELTYRYLQKAAGQRVLYAEMFFDPQLHTRRGVAFRAVINGITRARRRARRDFGIHSRLIMCFVREMSAESALETLDMALRLDAPIVGVGLDSYETGNPPAKFARVFSRARAAGLRLTAHCDLDQPDSLRHIRQALADIRVDRIDHGLNILADPGLQRIALQREVTFTLCPYANEVVRPGRAGRDLRRMLQAGLALTLNSDDPALMDGCYITENMLMAQQGADLTREELLQISRNAFYAAWAPQARREEWLAVLAAFRRRQALDGPVC